MWRPSLTTKPSGGGIQAQDAIDYLDAIRPKIFETELIFGTETDIRQFSPADISTLIYNHDAAATVRGENGWVVSGGLAMSGSQYPGFLGIPTTANEIRIKFQGVSPTTTANFALHVRGEDGLIKDGSDHFGWYVGAAQGSANGTYIPIALAVAATQYVSGSVELTRHQVAPDGSATFLAKSHAFEAATREYRSIVSTPNVGAGIIGLRLSLNTGLFDSGTAYIMWRE